MRPDGRLPRDQAEIAFSDCFVEQLAALRAEVQEEILADVVALCERPGGSHTLSADERDRTLVGWNTLEVCGRELRVVYEVDEADASIYVLCTGPRRAGEVYDQAKALARSGLLGDAATTLAGPRPRGRCGDAAGTDRGRVRLSTVGRPPSFARQVRRRHAAGRCTVHPTVRPPRCPPRQPLNGVTPARPPRSGPA